MKAVSFAAIFGAAASLCACSAHDSGSVAAKNGPDGSRSFAATGFTGVELAGSDDVIVKQGKNFSVVATGPQAVLDKLEVEVEDGVLVIRRKPSTFSWGNGPSAEVTVTLPTLDRAEVSGSGQMDVDAANGDAVAAVLSGSGNLALAQVTAKKVAISLAGSGDLEIKGGTADTGAVSLAGSGDIDVAGLTLTNAKVSVAGSGDVDISATTAAEVSILGSGDVRVRGGAKCASSEMGSGTVSCS